MVKIAIAKGRGFVRTYLPELIYGANNGIVTTLAIVSGVTGANLSSKVVLILGFANLLADGFSMGASNVLSERSRPERERQTSLKDAYRHGAATTGGFVAAGLLPLLAYLLPWFEGVRFAAACALAGGALFAIGAARALFTEQGWRVSGLEMLLLGGLAAVVAYIVGAIGAFLIGEQNALLP
ncbi:VIT1/CCC1 transporter family protein [Afifella pfennigii]|uniref:VIT1/CCC1 transporter family protein n=1 Tax=Afifella pfennigii TaxID=209897 RepID=UPI00068A3135|nr:VIT1/CCC1 transporter family protein [Afifella pfennigii]